MDVAFRGAAAAHTAGSNANLSCKLLWIPLMLMLNLLLLKVNRMKKKIYSPYLVLRVALATSVFGLALSAEAASVYKCSASGNRCVVKLEEGIIGDHVKVMDEKARTVAEGRIVSRKGAYGVISVANSAREIRRGFPVVVNIDSRSSNLQWAASFSDKE
jgi:hypothetical protein